MCRIGLVMKQIEVQNGMDCSQTKFVECVHKPCAINLRPGGLCSIHVLSIIPVCEWQHPVSWISCLQHNLVFMPWLLRFFHSCHHWKSSSLCWIKSGKVMENCTSRLRQWKQWLRGKITDRFLAFQSLMALSLPGVGCKWFASVLQSLGRQSKPFLCEGTGRGAHAVSCWHAETVE